MSKNDTLLLKGFIVFMVLLGIAVTLSVYSQRATSPPAKAASEDSMSIVTPISSPKQPTTSTTNVHSAKGNKNLILKTTTDASGTTSYELKVADIDGGNVRSLFTKTLGSGASVSLPLNAWDPTDTYVFIEEKIGAIPDYLVLKSSGEPFADGEKSIHVGAVWTQKKIGYSIREATGWASGTLLVIYTSKSDGTKGPPYWFEIPSTAIIQLSG